MSEVFKLRDPWDRTLWHPDQPWEGAGTREKDRPLSLLAATTMVVSAQTFMGGASPVRWLVSRADAEFLASNAANLPLPKYDDKTGKVVGSIKFDDWLKSIEDGTFNVIGVSIQVDDDKVAGDGRI